MEYSSAEEFLEGKVILIDKDVQWTSFDVVNKLRFSIRNEFGIKKIKVGHAGTLDPLASGLVIICTGKATKSIDSFMGLEKEYVAKITLGGTTPSYDLESEIDQTFPYEHISRPLLESALQSFLGEIEQAPPIFSAKQIDGKRAYILARRGEEVILKKNLITIHEI
jgi:tRNA pseudouridine55 synthase